MTDLLLYGLLSSIWLQTAVVLLDPDVAQAFPSDEAVNAALRLLRQVAQRQQLKAAGQRIE